MNSPSATAGPAAPRPASPAAWDEAWLPSGAPRPHYADVLPALEAAELPRLRAEVAADLHSRGVSFGLGADSSPFVVDPVPRVFPAEEWKLLEAGLAQRVRALNAFLADAYSERRMEEAGRFPAGLVEGAQHYEPLMAGMPDVGVAAPVAGPDVVRAPDGVLKVLEDNVRTPSGLAYALAARDVLDERSPAVPPAERRSLAGCLDRLADSLRSADPHGTDDPSIALLSDGPANSAWYEHERLARVLEVPLVTLEDLEQRGGRLCARLGDALVPIDVLYRRTDEDRLTDDRGRLTPLGELVLRPLRDGDLACVNAFGNGVADDKRVHAYVEDMIAFYLEEEPVIRSVQTYDLAEPEVRAEALERIGELVVKPRDGYGGYGVVICPHATAEDRERAAASVRDDPEGHVAQETIQLSVHPTVAGDRLEPRHVDLRPFVIASREDVHVVPGGLTRAALDAGALVVNSSQNGGGKDTWVLE